MTAETETAAGASATHRPSRVGVIAARIGEAAVEGTLAAARAARAWASDPKTKAAGRAAIKRSGDLARAGVAAAAPVAGRLAARIGLGDGLAVRATRVRERYEDYRREREMDELATTLDRLSDRQLAILGLDRSYLYTDLEARAEALAASEAETDAPETAAADAGGDGEPAGPTADNTNATADETADAPARGETADDTPTASDPDQKAA